MGSPTLILASGRGRESLYKWLSGSVYLPASLLLVVRFESSNASSPAGSGFFEVSYQSQHNDSRLLHLVLPPMSSGWRLTLWSVLKVDSGFSLMCGPAGVAAGEA